MTAVVAVLVVVVAVLTVLVAGLLRSHALVLRRLHEAGLDLGALGDAGDAAPSSSPGPGGAADTADERLRAARAVPAPTSSPSGRPAVDLVGLTPSGGARSVAVVGVDHDTLLLFLSSDCATCRPFWEAVADGGAAVSSLPEHVRLVVVTKGPSAESPAAVAAHDVAVPLVMSDDAWQELEVPGSPYAVHVDGPSGRVRGEGTGGDWSQVAALLARATGDVALVGGGTRSPKARRDALAERDTDEALLAAGVLPGDDSLYRRADGTSGTGGPGS